MSTNAIQLGTTLLDTSLEIDLDASPAAPAKFMYTLRDWAIVVTGLIVEQPEVEPPLAGLVRVLHVFWAETSGEGFEFRIDESEEARHIDLVEEGCRRIGAAQSLRALAAVRAVFPAGFPPEEDDRPRNNEDIDDALDDISGEWSETINAEIPDRLQVYLREHLDEAVAELSHAKVDRATLASLAAEADGPG